MAWQQDLAPQLAVCCPALTSITQRLMPSLHPSIRHLCSPPNWTKYFLWTRIHPSLAVSTFPHPAQHSTHIRQTTLLTEEPFPLFVYCLVFMCVGYLHICTCVSRRGSQSMHVHVKPGGQLQASSVPLHLNFLTQGLPLNLDLMLLVRLVGQPALGVCVRISTSLGLGYRQVLLCLAFYVVYGGSALRSSWLHSKCFAH